MEEKKSAKSLLEMNCKEAEGIIERRKNNKNSLVSQIQFSRFVRHCLDCDKCEAKAKKASLLISSED